MEPIIPLYPQGASVDLDLVKQRAGERVVPSSLLQRRDGQGQYLSYKDVPVRAVPGAASVCDTPDGMDLKE